MQDSLGPLSVLAAAQSSTTDLSSACSVTLIIHGVGNQTSEGLLGEASNGYIDSDLHGVSRRTTLTECPALSDEKGAQSLVVTTSAGDHFVVALPWARRRTRLSSIAKRSAGLLLLITIAMGVTFIFRGTLEWLEHGLESWFHWLIAYALMTGFNYAVHVLRSDPSDGEFKRPSMSYLFLPPLLLVGLMFFVEGTWLWIATAALVVAFWLTSTVIVTRCLLVAPTLGWRVALAALIAAMSLPSAAILRIARHSAIRAEREYGALDSPYIHLPRNMLPLPFLDSKTQPDGVMESAPAEEPRFNRKADDSTPDLNQRPHFEDKTAFGKLPVASAGTRTSPSGRDPVADAESSDSALNGGDAFMKALLKYKPSIVDVVTAPEFMTKFILAVVCIGLCVLVMGYSWLLDFGFDVLHYGGSDRHRTSLVDATAKTIRWFHEQAPNARIVIVGHSLGSVIAAQTVVSLRTCESSLTGIVLVTLGSPLNYIGRAFPKSVPPVRELAAAICGSACQRWINLWLSRDLIGKSLDIGDTNTGQFCVGKGGGHTDYWSGGEVWKAVAFEALGIGGGFASESSGTAGGSVFERSLGLLVFASIIVIGSCGVGLWLLCA